MYIEINTDAYIFSRDDEPQTVTLKKRLLDIDGNKQNYDQVSDISWSEKNKNTGIIVSILLLGYTLFFSFYFIIFT